MRTTLWLVLLCSLTCSPARADAPGSAREPTTVDRLGPVQVGKPAPPFGAERLDGKGVIGLDDLLGRERGDEARGGRAVVVSFFATWCKPCKPGLKVLQAEADALHGRGLRVALVAVGQRGSKPRDWLRDLGITMPAVGDHFYSVSERYGVAVRAKPGQPGEPASLPRTFVIDREGVVRVIYADERGDFAGHLRRALEDLL